MVRVFIALEMNTAVQRHLTNFTRRVAPALPALRWVDPATIHLTLAFLGEIDAAQLALAHDAAQEAAQGAQPFSYRLTGVGIFGTPRQPRVLWMGIEESADALQKMYQRLKQALDRRGFVTEARPFSPHLTLARAKVPLPPAQQTYLQDLLARQTHASPDYPVSTIQVIRSELRPSGALYTPLYTLPFGP